METKNEGSDSSCASTSYAVPPHLQLQMERVLRLARRLEKAESLLRRIYNGIHKEHWQEGESEREVCEAISCFLDESTSA